MWTYVTWVSVCTLQWPFWWWLFETKLCVSVCVLLLHVRLYRLTFIPFYITKSVDPCTICWPIGMVLSVVVVLVLWCCGVVATDYSSPRLPIKMYEERCVPYAFVLVILTAQLTTTTTTTTQNAAVTYFILFQKKRNNTVFTRWSDDVIAASLVRFLCLCVFFARLFIATIVRH